MLAGVYISVTLCWHGSITTMQDAVTIIYRCAADMKRRVAEFQQRTSFTAGVISSHADL